MTAGVNPCQEFFERHTQTPDKAAELRKSGQALAWEQISASRCSPGPVQNHENVLRLVVNPVHVDLETGMIKPSLVSDVKDKGGSVHRLSHISRDAAIAVGRDLAQSKNSMVARGTPIRSIYGTVEMSVEDIRALVVSSKARAFGVFDTAKPADHSHADIFQLVPVNGQEARSARLQIFALAKRGFQPVA